MGRRGSLVRAEPTFAPGDRDPKVLGKAVDLPGGLAGLLKGRIVLLPTLPDGLAVLIGRPGEVEELGREGRKKWAGGRMPPAWVDRGGLCARNVGPGGDALGTRREEDGVTMLDEPGFRMGVRRGGVGWRTASMERSPWSADDLFGDGG